MKSTRRDEGALPANHAFVVQLSHDALGTPASFRGRAEHVVSGHATHFETLEELLAFMRHELATAAQSIKEA